MKDYINKRVITLAEYILENKATVRSAAKNFGISKSTVHKDVSERLKKLDSPLYEELKKLLEINKAQRHIRGGEATRQKYATMNLYKIKS